MPGGGLGDERTPAAPRRRDGDGGAQDGGQQEERREPAEAHACGAPRYRPMPPAKYLARPATMGSVRPARRRRRPS